MPVTVTLTPTDNAGGSGMSGGLAKTEYKLDDAVAWTTGTSVIVAAPASHSGDGLHSVSYRSTDAAGNLEAAKSVTVKIDTTAPSGSFTLSGGAATTTTTSVSGDSSVTDAHGPLEMRFSTDGKASWTGWEAYAASRSITLSGGLGSKIAYAQYRDAAGNVGEISDTIQLVAPSDITPPTTAITGADALWHNAAVTLTLTPTDDIGGSGMSEGLAATEYKIDAAASWSTGTEIIVGAPTNHSGDGTHTISYRSTDNAGNIEATKSCTVKIDTTSPAGSFTLAGGAATTTTTAVAGTSAVTEANGPLDVRFSLDGKASWSVWGTYAVTKALTLPGSLGAKTVYAQYRDAAGNVLELSDAIELIAPPDTTAPTTVATGADALWHNAAVTVTLAPTDDVGGSGMAGGLATTEYKICLLYTSDAADE